MLDKAYVRYIANGLSDGLDPHHDTKISHIWDSSVPGWHKIAAGGFLLRMSMKMTPPRLLRRFAYGSFENMNYIRWFG
jgi:hypothetical protein